jgi:lysozyme family protein
MSRLLKFNEWNRLNEVEADPGVEAVQPAVSKPTDQMTQAEKDMAQITNWARDKGKALLQAGIKQDEQNRVNRIISGLTESAAGKNLGKNVINLKGNAHLQVFLKKLGLLNSKAGPLGDGVTCYFNGETESALKALCGLDKIDFSNTESMVAFSKSFVDRPEVLDMSFNQELIKMRDAALAAKKPELKVYIDTGLLRPHYEKVWSSGGPSDSKSTFKDRGKFSSGNDYKLDLTGNITDDMHKFNSVKEGGLADDPRDSGPAATPCPYEYDASTGKMVYNGTTYQLKINPRLQDSVSVINGGSSSNRWHTSRGVIWTTWKTAAAMMGISNPLDVAKGFFEMTDENAKNVYMLTFYNSMVKAKGRETSSQIVNHCMGTGFWGSITHGEKTIANTLTQLSNLGYSGLDDAIQKIGDKTVVEVMLNEQIKLYLSYSNASTYGKGWTLGLLNFHRYFVPVYADLPSQSQFPEEYAKRESAKTAGFSGLAQFA